MNDYEWCMLTIVITFLCISNLCLDLLARTQRLGAYETKGASNLSALPIHIAVSCLAGRTIFQQIIPILLCIDFLGMHESYSDSLACPQEIATRLQKSRASYRRCALGFRCDELFCLTIGNPNTYFAF